MSRPVPRRYSPRSRANRAVHKPRALTANALDGGVIAAFSRCLPNSSASW